MPKVSVIMPVYNVEAFVAAAVESVLAQTHTDFELLIVDDCSPDTSVEICRRYADPRIRILRHTHNRGLAGARNTGIHNARGEYLAFLDSDDLWHPEKLARHLRHLERRPEVGLSFSRSAFIDADGRPTRCYQMPRLSALTAGHTFCRNPIGNGSAPVLRRAALEAIAWQPAGADRVWYFDESLRRSEDIECWVRIMLSTSWELEGLAEPLTLYRLNAGGLSASLLKQLESWEAVVEKTRAYAPRFIERWEQRARAYQLRYLARQAIRLRDGRMAMSLLRRALRCDAAVLAEEPGRTLLTAAAALLLAALPERLYLACEALAQRGVGWVQRRTVARQLRAQAI